jgi:cysteine desulfurase / selenocysteine lyase
MIETFTKQGVKNKFPILSQPINNKPLKYLDNGATTHKPNEVIDALTHYYTHANANIRRGIHALSERSDFLYEESREKTAGFINAPSKGTVVFTSGATESINIVAHSFTKPNLKRGDHIVLTTMEHHANIIPWQQIANEVGAELIYVPFSDEGILDMDALKQALTPKCKMLACIHVSNVLGTLNPVKEICALAKQHNIPTLIDGTQSAPHMPVDMQDLDCDFFVFSAHKMYGPTGVGVLYGKAHHLETMQPFMFGGGIIHQVTHKHSTFLAPPHRFEAGTPNIAGIIGFGACIDFINELGIAAIYEYEMAIFNKTLPMLESIEGLKMYGTTKNKAPIFSFTMDDIHAHDLATIADTQGVAIRSGMHCASLIFQHYDIPSAARGSIAIYNTVDDVEMLAQALLKAKKLFG